MKGGMITFMFISTIISRTQKTLTENLLLHMQSVPLLLIINKKNYRSVNQCNSYIKNFFEKILLMPLQASHRIVKIMSLIYELIFYIRQRNRNYQAPREGSKCIRFGFYRIGYSELYYY